MIKPLSLSVVSGKGMYLSPARLKRAGFRAAGAKWAFLLLEEREGLLQDGGFRGEAARWGLAPRRSVASVLIAARSHQGAPP